MYREPGSTRRSPKLIVVSSKLESVDVLPNQERTRQVNGVQRPHQGWKGLRGPIEDE